MSLDPIVFLYAGICGVISGVLAIGFVLGLKVPPFHHYFLSVLVFVAVVFCYPR